LEKGVGDEIGGDDFFDKSLRGYREGCRYRLRVFMIWVRLETIQGGTFLSNSMIYWRRRSRECKSSLHIQKYSAKTLFSYSKLKFTPINTYGILLE
jgi:hypothetical protein